MHVETGCVALKFIFMGLIVPSNKGRKFHRFWQAKFPDGLVLGSCQFSILPKLPLKTMLNLKSGQNQLKNNHLASLI